jgi:hypothetical protein
VNSTTAAHLSPLGTQECNGISLDENSGSFSPIPIDIITARLGLKYLWEASQPHQRRPPYDAHIAISTSLALLPVHSPRHIAIIMTKDGCCALLTQGVIMRQECEGLVKLLPQRQSSHREIRALLHPTRTQPPPPLTRLGRITTFLVSGTAPRLTSRPDGPSSVRHAHSPSPANLSTLSNPVPRIVDLTPHDTSSYPPCPIQFLG